MRSSGTTAGQLAATVAHQLNTPLGAMRVAVELAIGSIRENPDKAFARLDSALQAVHQMQTVLAGLTQIAWDQPD